MGRVTLTRDTGSDLPCPAQVLLYRTEDNAPLWRWDIVVAAARAVLVLELGKGNRDGLRFLNMAAVRRTGPPELLGKLVLRY